MQMLLYDTVILETDRALFIYFGGFGVIKCLRGWRGGALISHLLFWVVNEGGSGKNTPNIRRGGGEFQKLKEKKSKLSWPTSR